MNNQPIGVIDSGVGGLNILTHLAKGFPHESFIYYGDTKNAPYGEKDIPTLKKLTEKMIRFMEDKEVKVLIIACNTITASGVLKEITTTIPHIIEIIEPTVRYAARNSKSHYFTLLAMDVTIKSGIYQSLLEKYCPKSAIESYSLPQLVRLAEQAKFADVVAESIVRDIVKNIKPNSTVILGCTHYPFFTPLFKKYIPTCVLVDSSQAVIEQVKELVNPTTHKQIIEFHASGNQTIFQTILNQQFNNQILQPITSPN